MIAALIAILAILMLSGSAGSSWLGDIDHQLKKQVPEKARRESVLAESKALDEGMKEVGKSLQEHFTGLLEAHIDYTSTEADFDKVSQQLKQDQARAFALDIAVRNGIHKELSKAEWKAVFSDDGKQVKPH